MIVNIITTKILFFLFFLKQITSNPLLIKESRNRPNRRGVVNHSKQNKVDKKHASMNLDSYCGDSSPYLCPIVVASNLNAPYGIQVSPYDGKVYFTDACSIQVMDPGSNFAVSTVVGDSNNCDTSQTSAILMNGPSFIQFITSTFLYVVDYNGAAIRGVTLGQTPLVNYLEAATLSSIYSNCEADCLFGGLTYDGTNVYFSYYNVDGTGGIFTYDGTNAQTTATFSLYSGTNAVNTDLVFYSIKYAPSINGILISYSQVSYSQLITIGMTGNTVFGTAMVDAGGSSIGVVLPGTGSQSTVCQVTLDNVAYDGASAVTIDSNGNYYCFDYYQYVLIERKHYANDTINYFDGPSYIIAGAAGTSSAYSFYVDYGIDVDANANVYVANYGDSNIVLLVAQETSAPTFLPTSLPSVSPTVVPSATPTLIPSALPTASPTWTPSATPTLVPSALPTTSPTWTPSALPSIVPSTDPTLFPSSLPTILPSSIPSAEPTIASTVVPSTEPTFVPSNTPSVAPTNIPSVEPTISPSAIPTTSPSFKLSSEPTISPTDAPNVYTYEPTCPPVVSLAPVIKPTHYPTHSKSPTVKPTHFPTHVKAPTPTRNPTYCTCDCFHGLAPTHYPTHTKRPTVKPTHYPTH